MVLSIIGTNDLHGALDRLAILAGYIQNLRAARANDGGLLVIDAGDMFQGTIESNSNEGAAVIDAYNAIGYTAVAIGNHEFDFGPVGEASSVATPPGPGAGPLPPEDDPLGALRQRVAQARFPMLAGNLLDARSGARIDWANAPASVIRQVAGIEVGIIGVTTEATLRTTLAANVTTLAIAPITETIVREATALRERGARIVIVTAHAGGACRDFSNPDDLSSCTTDDEIMNVARELPPGTVDVIVAGHTHQAMAHRVHGIAIIESYAQGRAFGRVDLTVDRTTGKVTSAVIAAPRELCPGPARVPVAECQPGVYEGKPVVPDPAVSAVIQGALERAAELRNVPLGVEVTHPVTLAYAQESALGNLFADLVRAAMPADVAIMNGGGLRAEIPAGPLTYGRLYEAIPFDNRFATVKMRGDHLARLIASNLQQKNGILLLSGARATARCGKNGLTVSLRRDNGNVIGRADKLTIVTSDFLATAGDGLLEKLGLPDGAVTLHDGPTLRDGMARVLRARRGKLDGTARRLFDAARPRIRYPGQRPVQCPGD